MGASKSSVRVLRRGVEAAADGGEREQLTPYQELLASDLPTIMEMLKSCAADLSRMRRGPLTPVMVEDIRTVEGVMSDFTQARRRLLDRQRLEQQQQRRALDATLQKDVPDLIRAIENCRSELERLQGQRRPLPSTPEEIQWFKMALPELTERLQQRRGLNATLTKDNSTLKRAIENYRAELGYLRSQRRPVPSTSKAVEWTTFALGELVREWKRRANESAKAMCHRWIESLSNKPEEAEQLADWQSRLNRCRSHDDRLGVALSRAC